jgi:hypothetical protein
MIHHHVALFSNLRMARFRCLPSTMRISLPVTLGPFSKPFVSYWGAEGSCSKKWNRRRKHHLIWLVSSPLPYSSTTISACFWLLAVDRWHDWLAHLTLMIHKRTKKLHDTDEDWLYSMNRGGSKQRQTYQIILVLQTNDKITNHAPRYLKQHTRTLHSTLLVFHRKNVKTRPRQIDS